MFFRWVRSLNSDYVQIFIDDGPFIKDKVEQAMAAPWVKHNLTSTVHAVDISNDISSLQLCIQSILTTRVLMNIRKAVHPTVIYPGIETNTIVLEMRPPMVFEPRARVPGDTDFRSVDYE
jgi:hypothetical protein